MRIFLIITLISTLFYSNTGLVYFESSFEGALVVKPYPMYPVDFGGGEKGAWARRHPDQPSPWFMQKGLMVITNFSWEQGEPAWITAYVLGYVATLLAYAVLALTGAVRLIRFSARRDEFNLSLKIPD